MIVLKFGGSLLNGIDGVRSVLREIAEIDDDLLIVVSAFAEVTNRLERLASKAPSDPDAARAILADLIEDHRRVGRAVQQVGSDELLEVSVDGYSEQLENLIEGLSITGELSRRTLDLIVHFGELLSSAIISSALGVERIPATDLLITDNVHRFATVRLPESRRRIQSRLGRLFEGNLVEGPFRVVTEGYIARGENGEITTMGRESSDYSASLLGRFLGAEEVRIYTGVPGIMSADPSLCPDARTIPAMSYAMAREIARLGAKIIHPRTVRPAEEEEIRLVLRDLAGQSTEIRREPGEGARSFPMLRDVLHLRCTLKRTNDGDDEIIGFLHERGALIRALRVGRELEIVVDSGREGLDEIILRRWPESVTMVSASRPHLISIVQDWPVGLDDAARFLGSLDAGNVVTFWGDPDDRSVSALVDSDDPGALLSYLHRQFLQP